MSSVQCTYIYLQTLTNFTLQKLPDLSRLDIQNCYVETWYQLMTSQQWVLEILFAVGWTDGKHLASQTVAAGQRLVGLKWA